MDWPDATTVVQIFYDLADRVTNASFVAGRYEVDTRAFDDLKGFVADFHEDNPGLWNLLSDKQRAALGPTTDTFVALDLSGADISGIVMPGPPRIIFDGDEI